MQSLVKFIEDMLYFNTYHGATSEYGAMPFGNPLITVLWRRYSFANVAVKWN